MKLSIVIPAYNEEDAIASIIERTLAAREHIIATSPAREVEVIVVSDGSTDRTVEIARTFMPEIKLIVFERNRGYGAAIKRGFTEGAGELVGFLDADGTCDPAFFAALCTALADHDAAVALGSRLGPQSRMPRIRRVGNRIYAAILSALSNRVVTDTASGMRVIRRDVLPQLYPLPDGLHFTPAMSARVLMDDNLGIVECPMPYEERVGESKLNVFHDGVRFLRTILEMTLMWQPSRLFAGAALACLAAMILLGVYPAESWLRTGSLHEDSIYRLLTCLLLGSLGAMLLGAGVISEQLRRLVNVRTKPQTFLWSLLGRVYSMRAVGVAIVSATPCLAWLIGPGVWTWLTAGYVGVHWSRVVLAGLITFAIAQQVATTLIVNIVRFHASRVAALNAGRIQSAGVAPIHRPTQSAAPLIPAV